MYLVYVLVDGLLNSFNHQKVLMIARKKNHIVIFGHWRYSKQLYLFEPENNI